MIRILASIVFALGILAASSAHASKLPASFEHVPGIGMAEKSAPCTAKTNTLSEKAGPGCAMSAHKTGGSQRCQVDVAPTTHRVARFGKQCLSVTRVANDSAPSDWVCQPMLGPPRFV